MLSRVTADDPRIKARFLGMVGIETGVCKCMTEQFSSLWEIYSLVNLKSFIIDYCYSIALLEGVQRRQTLEVIDYRYGSELDSTVDEDNINDNDDDDDGENGGVGEPGPEEQPPRRASPKQPRSLQVKYTGPDMVWFGIVWHDLTKPPTHAYNRRPWH